jgi:hypothetical protein
MGGRCRRCRRSPQVDAEAVVDGGRLLQPVEAGGDLGDLFGEVLVDADRVGELREEVVGQRAVCAQVDRVRELSE